jgi:hypothetical protein
MRALVLAALLSTDGGRPVACATVADCWLDPKGAVIPRPAKLKGKKLPQGDCGKNLLWLRHRLTCEEQVCTVKYVGDAC